ncbi:MAG: nuclear transport factor 2 family protein [Emcibacter sp.]|nr:nuclear transport factor 2 family protein [Emcibacter sp.]
MKKILYVMSLIMLFGVVSARASDDKADINALVDGFHEAASQADRERYLGFFTDDGVFMGTDDWERWVLNPAFKDYVAERFKGGTGWTYKSLERHIAFSPDHKVAWFDEITKSEKWGLFRGTGVLLKQDNGWKIAHYSMSVLVPNEAWVSISDLAKAAVKRRNAEKK